MRPARPPRPAARPPAISPRGVAVLALAAAALWAGALLAGCGPSFQAIYEGEARFEHCYALEENATVAMSQKAECWRDWGKRYTYGQTRDRVEYAAIRVRALERVPALPTDEAMMGAAPGAGDDRSWITAPAPTNAFAPPPKTLDGDGDAGAARPTTLDAPMAPAVAAPGDDGGAPKVTRPPLADCTDGCGAAWGQCKSSCKDKACDACDKSYKGCLRACSTR